MVESAILKNWKANASPSIISVKKIANIHILSIAEKVLMSKKINVTFDLEKMQSHDLVIILTQCQVR